MNKLTRNYLLMALAGTLLQLFVFKICYPFPSFFPDSYTYIGAAIDRSVVSVRPIGYSWFLLLVHAISTSDTFLICIQYALVQAAACYLFITIRLLYRPSKWPERLLFVILMADPLMLYISNTVSSDALFTALSLVWFVGLLRLMHRPSWWQLLLQTVLLFLIFYIRYNALFYPLVAAVACWLSGKTRSFTVAGIAASILVVVAGIKLTEQANFRRAGTRTFSGFGGWQMANNALHIYPYITVDTTGLPSPECRDLDRYVKRYFGNVGPQLRAHPMAATTDYMWNEKLPLKRYYTDQRIKDHTNYYTAWSRVGPLYSRYGNYLAAHHPFLFSRYYLLPSAATFFLPSLETFAKYNEGTMLVDSAAMEWFHYPGNTLSARSATIQGTLLCPFPWLYMLLNILVVLAIALFAWSRPWRVYLRTKLLVFYRGCLLTVAWFATSAAFGIFATPTVFRYQLISLTLLIPFVGLYFMKWNSARQAPKE